jgi:hypothetical protein
MTREVMTRSSSDNEYMHRDFYGALSTGIQYLQDTYGPDAVIQWLQQVTDALYNPLRRDVKSRGLVAIREYMEEIYAEEGGQVDFEQADGELKAHICQCPALTHIKENGYPVADMWVETTRTVYTRLLTNTKFGCELMDYDDQTGETTLRFFRRSV